MLTGMEDTFKEYQQWSDEVVMETSLPQYITALNMLNKLLPCETSLVSSNQATVLVINMHVVIASESTSQCRGLPFLLGCCQGRQVA